MANPAARAFVASRVAISSAGGLISQLFDLRGKVDKNELEELIRSVGVKQPAGKEILKQDGREDRRLYVVRHGEVRLVRSEEGTDYTLATLGQGDTFGEKACLMRQEQFAAVVAATDVAAGEKTVQFLLGRNPKLREALEERVRLLDRELQRQKKLAERASCRRCWTWSRRRSSARRSSRVSPACSRPRRWIAGRPAWR